MEKIVYLKKYIEENLHDMNGGNGEYLHSPYIKRIINDLNESESLDFTSSIENWNEKLLFELADPILFGENKYLDKDYLYILIYLKVTEKNNCEYLLDNLVATILDLKTENCSFEFLNRLKEKLIIDTELSFRNNNIAIKVIEDKIASKI